MEIRIVRTNAGFEALGDAWRALEDAHPALPHHLSFDYVAAWVRTRPTEHELVVAVAEDHAELVGVLPLVVVPRVAGPLRWRELQFVTEGDHRDAIVDGRRVSPSTTVKALLAGALESADGVRRINLRYLADDSPLTHHLFRSHEHNRNVRPLVEIPRVDLTQPRDFAAYRRTVPRSSLTSLNKLRRELALEVAEVRPVTADLFAELVSLHRREKDHLVDTAGRRDRRSLFEDPRRMAAYRQLVVDQPHASAFVARTGEGRLAFYELAWRRGRRVWAWNTAYEPEFAKLRPSRARIASLEALFAAGDTDSYDLGAGRYPWKFELTSTFSLAYEWSTWVGDDPVTRVLRRVRP